MARTLLNGIVKAVTLLPDTASKSAMRSISTDLSTQSNVTSCFQDEHNIVHQIRPVLGNGTAGLANSFGVFDDQSVWTVAVGIDAFGDSRL